MWFRALDDIASRSHWRLVLLWKLACPASPLSSQAPGNRGDWVACDQWHNFAINRINQIDPSLLIISQASYDLTPNGGFYTPKRWKRGLEQLLMSVSSPHTVKLVLGDIPLPTGPAGPNCLAQHIDEVQACSNVPSALRPFNIAEERAATAEGARYVSVTPWFCAKECSPVIGSYDVYWDTHHVAVGYSLFLEGVLTQALNLPSFGQPRSRL